MNDLLSALNPAPDAPLTTEENAVAEQLLGSILATGAGAGPGGPSWRWLISAAAVGLVATGVVGVSMLRPPQMAIAPGAGPGVSVAPTPVPPLAGPRALTGADADAAVAACKALILDYEKQDPSEWRKALVQREFHTAAAQRDGDVGWVSLVSEVSVAQCHARWASETPTWELAGVQALPSADVLVQVGPRELSLEFTIWGTPSYVMVSGLVGADVTGVVLDTGTQRIRGTLVGRQYVAWTASAEGEASTSDSERADELAQLTAGSTFELTFSDGSTALGVRPTEVTYPSTPAPRVSSGNDSPASPAPRR